MGAREDLTGISTVTWHESMRPWLQKAEEAQAPTPMPAGLVQLREGLRKQAMHISDANQAWFAVPNEMRCLLIALCTERDPARGHMFKWTELTDTEKTTIGVQARSFVRGLGKVAEWLR